MDKMKIIYKPITSLCAANYNPRKITEKQREAIRQSIRKFGTVEPLVINTYKGRENIIVGGHRRSEILQQEGHTEAPCVEVCLNQEDEKELNIRLNKNTGEFDYRLLESFFEKSELVGWGFEEMDLDGMWDMSGNGDGDNNDSNSNDEYGDKNKEIDIDSMDDEMKLTFKMSSDQYDEVTNKLSDIDDDPLTALLEVLGVN